MGDNHHHLICRACGRMVDVDCAVGAAPCLTPADSSGYEIDEAEVVYWGRCPQCLARARDRSGVEEETGSTSRAPHGRDASKTDRATDHDQTNEP